MPLPKSLTTVTPFSKFIALFLFILFPFAGFYVGIQYQTKLDHPQTTLLPISPSPTETGACTMDAKQCPDGSYVGRLPPDCAFAVCPKNAPAQTPSSYQCPKTQYVDCMPKANQENDPISCSQPFLEWATKNCPGFKGAAY